MIKHSSLLARSISDKENSFMTFQVKPEPTWVEHLSVPYLGACNYLNRMKLLGCSSIGKRKMFNGIPTRFSCSPFSSSSLRPFSAGVSPRSGRSRWWWPIRYPPLARSRPRFHSQTLTRCKLCMSLACKINIVKEMSFSVGATTLSRMTHSIITLSIQDAQHNDTQHNNIKHNDAQHKGFLWHSA